MNPYRPSILNAPRPSAPQAHWRRVFTTNLVALLEDLHQSSTELFQPGRGGSGKQLIPESAFAARLARGFELLGWETEKESLSAAGRTDLKMKLNGSSEWAVVEVKIWGRNEYRHAHRQIESYWTPQIGTGAVVQITDAEIPDWPERYRRQCLDSLEVNAELRPPPLSPIRAHFSCRSKTTDGMIVLVDHYLLCLARR